MVVKDNKTGIPLEHYRGEFSLKDPAEMCLRCGAKLSDNEIYLSFLGREVKISHPSMEMEWVDTGNSLPANARILLGRYLIGGRAAKSSGHMLSYAETPWGEVYLQSFRGRCLSRLAFGYGFAPEKFREAYRAIGAQDLPGSGVSCRLELLPGFYLHMTVWQGEDDIPPASQVLFSDNFPESFSAEDMAVVGDIVIDALKGRL